MLSNLLKAYHERFGIKLFVIFTALACIISVSLSAFYIYHQRGSLTANLIKNGTLLSTILAYNSRLGVFSENGELLDDPVNGIMQQEGVLAVSVFNLEKILLKKAEKSAGQIQEGPGIGDRRALGNDAGDNGQGLFDRLEKTGLPLYLEGKDRLAFWAPVISSSDRFLKDTPLMNTDPSLKKARVIGFASVIVDERPLKKRLRDLLFKGVFIGLVFLIIGSGALYLVVRGVTGPLNRLTRNVKIFGRGGVVEAFPLETRDEVAKLAMAFNEMAESLKNKEAEKVQLELQLRHSQKMEAIGTLSGGVAHDFNNILGIIAANTELAKSEVPDGSPSLQNMDEVIRAVTRAKDLIMQILTFSHKNKQEQRPIQIAPIVKECLRMMRASLPATIEFRQNIENEPGVIMSDPTQIHQALINLCINAAHAMREKGGILEVTLENVSLDEKGTAQYQGLSPGKYLWLRVRDTGTGIEPKVLERIFEPYFTTKGVGEGSGMGLAVVHGIVKRNGGDIQVESELGKGTCFHILFPVIEAEAKPEVEPVMKLLRGRERILFVDDEETLLYAARHNLEGFGYSVITEKNPGQALMIFKNRPYQFDLVITDMTMPGMSGDRLAKEIMKFRPDIPVIICTGFSEQMTEEKATEMGIKAFVMKPILTHELTRTIRKVLDVGKKDAKKKDAEMKACEKKGESDSPKRILVVDDEKPMRSILRQMLERAGYEVLDAPDGKSALCFFKEKPADLIITDLIMPGKEGLEMIMDLKKDFPKVKIIAMSGGGQQDPKDSLDMAIKLGADCTLCKPFDRDDLLMTVKELMVN